MDFDSLREACDKLYSESLRLTKLTVKLAKKAKLGEKENEKLKQELSEAQAIIDQLKSYRETLRENFPCVKKKGILCSC